MKGLPAVLSALLVSMGASVAPAWPTATDDQGLRMTHEARGHFEIATKPEATMAGGVGRFSIDKTFQGDLNGKSVGEMLAVRTPTPGSAGYVLIEQFTGTVNGRSGAFLLQHYGVMDRGKPELKVVIVPDSGSGDLTGIAGEMSIDAADNHAYVLRYSGAGGAPDAAAPMPPPDLVALWEAHTRSEFETRDVEATMATMVAEPYVNHVPTLAGGVGHDELKRFYKHHFIGANPPDTALAPISRTVGADQIVDEMLFSFTHTSEIDWMLPGVAPTGRRVEVALVAIVRFEAGKVAHEHIYWDQASVLVQVGLLDPSRLPVAGVESARKVLDKTLPSNGLMAAAWKTSEGRSRPPL